MTNPADAQRGHPGTVVLAMLCGSVLLCGLWPDYAAPICILASIAALPAMIAWLANALDWLDAGFK